VAGELIVGIGGDGSGFEAARTAARVCHAMGRTMVLVFGYESSPLGPRGGALDDEIKAIGDDAVARILPELQEQYPALEVEVLMVAQRPVDALISVAEARQAEAICVGHGGSGPLKAALLGSITYEIVHRAPLPVLVVPNDDDDTE
jgi:nucleotide-binding universal stress UspA family protein